jgi:hypothetical protein
MGPPSRPKGAAVKQKTKAKPVRLDVFTDQKRAEAEKRRIAESVAFMAGLKPSKWVKS